MVIVTCTQSLTFPRRWWCVSSAGGAHRMVMIAAPTPTPTPAPPLGCEGQPPC